jgi:beta-phosphoglucomutase-like phosphatase (HAD superfamily)
LIFDLDGTLFRTDTVSIPAAVSAAPRVLVARDETIIDFFAGRFRTSAPLTDVPGDGAGAHPWTSELQLVRERGQLYPGVHETLTALRPLHLAVPERPRPLYR